MRFPDLTLLFFHPLQLLLLGLVHFLKVAYPLIMAPQMLRDRRMTIFPFVQTLVYTLNL